MRGGAAERGEDGWFVGRNGVLRVLPSCRSLPVGAPEMTVQLCRPPPTCYHSASEHYGVTLFGLKNSTKEEK